MFRFRLQRVLELREKQEKAQALELARAEEAATAARKQRDDLAALHAASRSQLASMHSGEPTVGHLHHLGFVLNALDQRLGHAAASVTSAENDVSTARVSLEVAARDRRVMDRLKDKHEDAHRGTVNHRERVTMDEIALSRFARQQDNRQQDNADMAAQDTKAAPASTGTNSTTPNRARKA